MSVIDGSPVSDMFHDGDGNHTPPPPARERDSGTILGPVVHGSDVERAERRAAAFQAHLAEHERIDKENEA